MKSLIQSGGVILLRNADPKDPNIGLNFEYFKKENNKKYELKWIVKDYNNRTRITTCIEEIKVSSLKGNLLDKACATVKQRWWTKDEIIKSARKAGLKAKIQRLQKGKNLYYVIRRR